MSNKLGLISKLVRYSIDYKWFVILITAILGGLGIVAFTHMTIDAYPDISGVQVEVITDYPGRAAEEIEMQISIPLERLMASVPKVTLVRSRTIFGLSLVQIQFEPEVDVYWARTVVNQKLNEIQLPQGAMPEMASLSTAYGEIYRYEIKGLNKSLQELRTSNDWEVIPRLKRVKGVAEVTNFGGLGKIYTVRVDKDKLLQYRVTINDIAESISKNNNSGGGSLLQRGSDSLVIRGLGRIEQYQEIENILIKNSSGTPVYIKDIGHVEIDHVPQTGIFAKDKEGESVEGIVRMRRGENPSIVLASLQEAVQELNQGGLSPDIKIVPFYDRTELINSTLHTVGHNTLVGIGLVLAVLLLFLGNVKVSLIVALTIPLSVLFALIFMYLANIPISLLSIGAIDFGIIVDGAVIVAENIIRHMHQSKETHKTFKQLLHESTSEVQHPMLISMAIVIVAYFPLLTLRYIEGLLFRPMAITLCFSFFGALLLALFYVPAAFSIVYKEGDTPRESHLFDKLNVFYKMILIFLMKRWKMAILSTAALLVFSFAVIIPKLGSEFLPYMDEGVFWLRANFPEGISLKQNSIYSNEIRQLILETEEISFVTSQTGRNDTGTDPFPTNRTEFMVGLKPREQWKNFKLKKDLEAFLQNKISNAFPTIRLNLTQPIIDSVTEDANGTSADLAVEIQGKDLQILRQKGKQIRDILRDIPGARNTNIEQEGPGPQLQIAIDRQKLALYQMSAGHVNDVINTAVGGKPISELYEGERRFDIVIKFLSEQVDTPSDIANIPIFSLASEPIPLAQLSSVHIKDGETLIARSNNQRRITVRTDIRNRSQGEFVAEAQKKIQKMITIPPGHKIEWKGMFENLERAKKHFILLIPATIGLIFLILFWNFRGLKLSLLILLTIPFSLVGSLFALWVRDMHINVSTGVGFTSLFGVAAMHGVMMLSYLDHKRKEHLPLQEAVLEGASLRLRPVVMTATVAILGLLPASLSTGIGSDIQRPMATVIVWGLFSSALMTLLILPVLYSVLFRGKKN